MDRDRPAQADKGLRRLVGRGLAELLKDDERPRGVQTMVERFPLSDSLTIVEAPTGSGKTEAALAYAWHLLTAGVADSVVFALPTQATANAMLAHAARLCEKRLWPRQPGARPRPS